MSIRDWWNKLKKETKEEAEKKKEEAKGKEKEGEKAEESTKYPNRFVKFYHLNKEKLNKERRGSYSSRRKDGTCVRCKRKVVPGIVFCEYHQEKQREYNKKARSEE
jgi:hypothetical protein